MKIVRLVDFKHFSPEKMKKNNLFQTPRFFCDVYGFEPGQAQQVHTHGGADKFYFIVSGKARMIVGEETRVAEPGDLVWAPADLPHGVVEALERTVMLVGIAPPP